MEKWMLIADVHINDYPLYNYTKRSRLNQFLVLAERIVELGRQNQCNKLVIAGDLLDRPTNRPYVSNVIDKFINTIKGGFECIYYILGQHSRDSKSNEVNPEDTILSIYDDEKFIHMNRQILCMGSGKRIAFKDWTNKQDLSWIENKVDILIGHYTKSDMFGQEIDESKFDLMIHGDIHNSQEIGKFISIGNPIQRDMSSQKSGTAIILNPETCEWNRIKIDPDHTRFLQIHYTRNREEDGFQGELDYYIYKPAIRSKSDTEEESQITLDWNEIDDLISAQVADKGLSTIHGEVLSRNPTYNEMDFNFQLKKLKIHGYRSIVDLEIDFSGNDRIVLVGDNGSGKSSVVKSLKSIFEKSREMKEEKSDFCKDVRVDLELVYQNKLYHIWRGTTHNGIEVEGQKLQYNNKTEFEKDIMKQLPFLSYLDLFFMTSDIQNLSDRFSPDRRITLLSRFYRLDRIQAYKSTADSIAKEKTVELNKYKSEIDKSTGSLNTINKRLEELKDNKDKKKSDLQEEVDRLNKIKDDAAAYDKWKDKLESYDQQLLMTKKTAENYKDRLLMDPEELNDHLKSLQDQKTSFNSLITSSEKRYKRLTELKAIRSDSYEKGVSIKSKISSLENNICPTCQTKLSSEKSQQKIKELTVDLEKERNRYADTWDEYDSYTEIEIKQVDYFPKLITNCKNKIKDIEDSILKYSTKIDLYNAAKKDNDRIQDQIRTIEENIKTHKKSEPEKVEVPIMINDMIVTASSNLQRYLDYEQALKDKEDITTEIQYLKNSMSDLQATIDLYYSYSELLSRHGEVMKCILDKLADMFSDNSIQYKVKRGISRNKPFIEFNSYFKVKDNWRIYESLSDGQKTISDLDFLKKLFPVRVGLLVLDETMKHLDAKMGPLAWEIISSMNVNSILISTHDANYSNFSKKIDLCLDPEGKTIATII